jgi:hypothetical protein
MSAIAKPLFRACESYLRIKRRPGLSSEVEAAQVEDQPSESGVAALREVTVEDRDGGKVQFADGPDRGGGVLARDFAAEWLRERPGLVRGLGSGWHQSSSVGDIRILGGPERECRRGAGQRRSGLDVQRVSEVEQREHARHDRRAVRDRHPGAGLAGASGGGEHDAPSCEVDEPHVAEVAAQPGCLVLRSRSPRARDQR